MYRFFQLLSLMILIQIFGYNSDSNAAQNGSCSVTSGEITETASGGNYHCYVDMQGAKVQWHALYLCTEQPALATYRSTCKEIYYSTAGATVEFLPNTTTAFPTGADVSIPIGTYNYVVMKVGKFVHDKMVVKFSTARQGKTTAGQYCWTIANQEYVKTNKDYTKAAVECGSEADSAAAGYAYQNSAYRCSGGNVVNSSSWAANSFGKNSITYKTTDDTTLFTPAGACPGNVTTTTDAGNYSVNMQQLAVPAVITADTKSIQFSMGFTGYGQITQQKNGSNGCAYANGCVSVLRSKAPEFKITVY
jgi:hypothetical protein